MCGTYYLGGKDVFSHKIRSHYLKTAFALDFEDITAPRCVHRDVNFDLFPLSQNIRRSITDIFQKLRHIIHLSGMIYV